jgi:anaerobic selenocysteine-containing dehydrogenase
MKKQGDNFQYGGPMLCAGSKFPTPDGKAHFKAVKLPQIATPAGAFRVITRRGKQFNSMVQEDTDPSNAAPRDAVLTSAEDATRLGLGAGDAVELENDFGTYHGIVVLAPVRPGTLEVHWPEGNVLVDPKARSPLATIPAYKEISATLMRIKENGERNFLG